MTEADWNTPDITAANAVADAALANVLAKLTPADVRLIVAAVRHEEREKLEETRNKITKFLTEILTFCVHPKPCRVKVMGVAYALDLPLHMGRPMAEQARSMGVSRAAISNAATSISALLKLPPSRWMRPEKTAEASRKARVKVCKQQTK